MKRSRKRASRAMSRCGLMLLLLAGASGCTIISRQYGAGVPESTAYEAHQTHYREVLKELGPPTDLSRMNDGMVFLYERSHLTERQLGINIDINDVPVLKFVYGKGRVKGETAAMIFDVDGLLLSQSWESWDRSLGSGTSLQMFISVMSVTDTGGYDRSPSVYHWGMDLANSRLPEALNRGSSLETGQNGLQRKGPILGAGQTSLEMRKMK